MSKLKFTFLMVLMAVLILPLNAAILPKENGKAKVDYSIGNPPQGRPHAPLRFNISVEEVNESLEISFIGNLSDVNITITDADGSVVYQETNGTIYDGKVINITPADGYPYDVAITSTSINIIGVIYLE